MITRTILDELQDLGFTPRGDGRMWFERCNGDRFLRVVLDDTDVLVHAMAENGVCYWTDRFSGTPVDLIATYLSITIGRWLV